MRRPEIVSPEIVSVVVATPVAGCFDYIVAEHLSVVAGSVVMVPFGNRRLPGIVLGQDCLIAFVVSSIVFTVTPFNPHALATFA